MIHANLMSYLGCYVVIPASFVIPACPPEAGLSGILLEERSWTSQDDRKSEGLPISGSDRKRDGLRMTSLYRSQ